jgi:hypothetical protein
MEWKGRTFAIVFGYRHCAGESDQPIIAVSFPMQKLLKVDFRPANEKPTAAIIGIEKKVLEEADWRGGEPVLLVYSLPAEDLVVFIVKSVLFLVFVPVFLPQCVPQLIADELPVLLPGDRDVDVQERSAGEDSRRNAGHVEPEVIVYGH